MGMCSSSRAADTKVRSRDFRLVATTQHDLSARVKAGASRADLSDRRWAIVLEVPSLKQRREDVAPLAQSFASNQQDDAALSTSARAALSTSARAALSAWQWPGNVCELKNVVERILALGEEAVLPRAGEGQDFRVARERALERNSLEALLRAAAREAEIARSDFSRMLEQHGVDPAKFRS
jgi:two-component system, NtrC family, nitrogen regulation response regulator NtrX